MKLIFYLLFIFPFFIFANTITHIKIHNAISPGTAQYLKDAFVKSKKEKATLIWCAKEAIYKWHQKGNIDFIKDIKLHNFEIEEKGLLTAEFKTEQLFLNYQKINNHYLVYVCK